MGFEVIHPKQMEQLIRDRHALVVDVREWEAYRAYHFRGAINCPYEEIERHNCRFPRRRALVIYCEHGSTSILAAKELAKAGYEVYAVAGGIGAIRHYFHD